MPMLNITEYSFSKVKYVSALVYPLINLLSHGLLASIWPETIKNKYIHFSLLEIFD